MRNGNRGDPQGIITLRKEFISQPALISPENSSQQTYQYQPAEQRMQR